LTKRTFKKLINTWEAETDAQDGVMLDSMFSPQVTQNEDSGRAIGFC